MLCCLEISLTTLVTCFAVAHCPAFLLMITGFSVTLYNTWWFSCLLNCQDVRLLIQSLFGREKSKVTNPEDFHLNRRTFITYKDICSNGEHAYMLSWGVSSWAQRADLWGLSKLSPLVSPAQSSNVQQIISREVRGFASMDPEPRNSKSFFVWVTFKVSVELESCHSKCIH